MKTLAREVMEAGPLTTKSPGGMFVANNWMPVLTEEHADHILNSLASRMGVTRSELDSMCGEESRSPEVVSS